jgi:hypothetical protein
MASLLPNNEEYESSSSNLALRAPLAPSSPNNEADGDRDRDHTPIIRPLLYRMYIACHILRLGTEARFSALVFLHRYAAAVLRSTTSTTTTTTTTTSHEDWKWVAAACLFLACKAEEEPRRLRDVINLAHMLLSTSSSATDDQNNNGNINHQNNKSIVTLQEDPPHLDEAYWAAKKKIVETEQVVLRWLAFDVSVSHPHRAVQLLLLKETTTTITTTEEDEEASSSSSAQNQLLLPIAFRRLNDALFHAPALKLGVLELACAAIELAKEEEEEDKEVHSPSEESNSSIHLRNDKDWWKKYNISEQGLFKAKTHLIEATALLKECADKAK